MKQRLRALPVDNVCGKRHRLNRADFIIDLHHRYKHRLCIHCFPQRIQVNDPFVVHRQIKNLKSLFL